MEGEGLRSEMEGEGLRDGGLEGEGWDQAWEMEADVWERLGLKMFVV